MNQTLYCSQTTVETETDTVEYIGEITSQPPSIAARSIMHTKVNCSLMSVTRRATCLCYTSFWRPAADLWDSKPSMRSKVLEIIKKLINFALPFPRIFKRWGTSTCTYVIGTHVARRLTSATLLSRPLRLRTGPREARASFHYDYEARTQSRVFFLFSFSLVGPNFVGLDKNEDTPAKWYISEKKIIYASVVYIKESRIYRKFRSRLEDEFEGSLPFIFLVIVVRF